VDSITNNQILKDTGAVVLSNSDEGQAAIEDYERSQSEESQAQMERDLEATLAPNSNPMQEHTEEELEAIRNQDKNEPFIPEQSGEQVEVGATETENEYEQPFVPEQVAEDPDEPGATDDRGDDPAAYPADSEKGQEMVDPGGSQPPENVARSRHHQHAELGASSEELAEKDAEQEEAAQQAAESGSGQPQSQEAARQNEPLADNEPADAEADNEGQTSTAGGGATAGAKKLADEEGVDLTQVEGSGPGGKVTKSDVEKHLNS
jgi:hypothetical protein